MPPHAPPSILITAGPTHEPIDAVRFIGNRSSGRLGLALADAAAARGHPVTLLLGPVTGLPADPSIGIHRFRTCEDLRTLLATHGSAHDVVIMAAAVADFRPKSTTTNLTAKFRRSDSPLVLELEPTPDLIAELAARPHTGQFLVAFALEPRDQMIPAAQAKLHRKGVDLVIANPLETMDSDRIDAIAIYADGRQTPTPASMTKTDFAPWLLDLLSALMP
ncbi:MAG: hypothetical protein IT435_12585 [Phycisphaerales bacterium]|nr:hypothetical protein [Phycisphaerales bacterium]